MVHVLAPNKQTKFDPKRLRSLLDTLSYELDIEHLDLDDVVDSVAAGLPATITVDDLLLLTAESLASRTTSYPDYGVLAGRVEMTKIQKLAENLFSANIAKIAKIAPNTLSSQLVSVAEKNAEKIDGAIDHRRDYELSYFAVKTLQKSYLLVGSETPQYMFMRVSLGIHGQDVNSAIETYTYMSQKYFIHASPTLFNSGTNYNHLSSCFLLAMKEDSIDGIYKTLHETALISKASGGIGLHVHNIRASGSRIASSNGTSSGLVPMLRVFNNTARYVDQGGNKRPGAFAIYLEPWHADIFEVLDLKKNHGKEEMRARDLFYALWIPDLFMERVRNDEQWSCFSPDQAPGLENCYGEEFKRLYESYEAKGLAMKVVRAQKLWDAILDSQIETGGPYMLYKDACNEKSNQKNLGTIKSSNLCCEVVQYSSPDEVAVCNLGSVALPMFVKNDNFDSQLLHKVTKVLVNNLNKVIDVTAYPLESARISNKKHRPIAVGVQGLADLFLKLELPFDSPRARELNIQVFETIYHAAVEASVELAIKDGPYETFAGSPASKGLLQFDLWNHKPSDLYTDWDELKQKVVKSGMRNSLLVAPMPTASTSQILGFNECFEPYTSNIYTRRVLAGEFQVVNKYLVKKLTELNLWNKQMKDRILVAGGSVMNIDEIPQHVRDVFKTVWDILQRTIIDMAVDRAKFIDQLQSLNIHMRNPTKSKLTSCHFYAWKQGLKTGLYYLRTQSASRAIQFTVSGLSSAATPLKRKIDEVYELSFPGTGELTPESQGYSPGEEKRDSCNYTPDEIACSSCSG